jgi:hypothetical protein
MTIVNPLVGARLSRRTTYREHILGTIALDTSNSTWVYVLADAALGSGATAGAVDANFHISAATGGSYAAGGTAFAVGEYGWVKKTPSPL